MNTNTLDINQYLNFIQEVDYDKLIAEQEYIMEAITLDDINKFTKNLNLVKKISAKYGIYENDIKKMVGDAQSKVRAMYDGGVSPEDAGKKFSLLLRKSFIKKLQQTRAKYGELRSHQKIGIALAGFVAILFTNTVIGLTLMSSPVGPVVAMRIVTIIVAPMVEEALKTFFIAKGMPWVGTSIVFGLELVKYMFDGMRAGLNVGKFLILRIAALLMHFTTTFVQKKIIDSADEETKSDAMFVAWITGFGIHMLWNLLGTVYNDEIAGWILKD